MCMCERERETVCWHDLMRRAKSNYLPSRGISELTQLAAIRPQVSKNICTHAHAHVCVVHVGLRAQLGFNKTQRLAGSAGKAR